MLATPEQVSWFKEVDPLLKDLMTLEPMKKLLEHGGAILLRAGTVKYEGGIFSMCQGRIEKDEKTSGK